MLYLRTGANGSCKTLFTLKDVRDLQVKESRPVAWNGRFKLKAEKEAEFGWKRIEFKDWQAEPDGTIFLIDECHNDMPIRPNSSPVPEHVRMLAEHRSRGFDFFLLTQHPGNIDSFVRKLIGPPGWHEHLKRAFGASNATSVLRWAAVNNNCEKDGVGKSAQITMRTQPKEVYDWYDSAMLHTGKRKIPKQVWLLAFCAVLIPSLIWYGVHTVGKPHPLKGAEASSVPGAPGVFAGSGAVQRDRPVTASEYVASYRPRIEGVMHTAPAYDKLTDPKVVPVPAACIENGSKGCKCFTQQATPYLTTSEICRQIVRNGVFLAFDPQAQGSGREGPEKQPASGAAGSASGPAPLGDLVQGSDQHYTTPVEVAARHRPPHFLN